MNPLARLVHATVKRWAPGELKRAVWDAEYRSGHWEELHPDKTAARQRDLIYSVLESYSRDADILDLACGPGSTAAEMPVDYHSYLGIDISPVAVETARTVVSALSDRNHKTEFMAADISRLSLTRRFHVILYRECLYYFSQSAMLTLLAQHRAFLRENGVMVARFHDRQRYAPLLDAIAANYTVLQRVEPADEDSVVLVFRPHSPGIAKEQS